MNNLFKIYLIPIVFISIALGYFSYSYFNKKQPDQTPIVQSDKQHIATDNKPNSTDQSIFKFHIFHGQDLGSAGFELNLPVGWYNDDQYFSPQKINHYDITSTDAPVYYDLISEALIDTSDLKYQITHDKRYKPDSSVTIDGKSFKKYDLIDYQSDGKDRVIIFAGPKINIFGNGYYLVFRFEEKPLGLSIPNNNPEDFEKMVNSLKFTQ